jgi:hypothetical protein
MNELGFSVGIKPIHSSMMNAGMDGFNSSAHADILNK